VEEEIESGIGLGWNGGSESIILRDWLPYSDCAWTVYDLSGRKLAEGDHLESKIPLPGLSSGIYIFLLQPSPGQNPIVKKFLR
jgi:hypothetical protein